MGLPKDAKTAFVYCSVHTLFQTIGLMTGRCRMPRASSFHVTNRMQRNEHAACKRERDAHRHEQRVQRNTNTHIPTRTKCPVPKTHTPTHTFAHTA